MLQADPGVRIRASALAAITAHARADPGRECCGFLIGTSEQIHEAAAATNVADDPSRRYEIASAEYFAHIRRCRDAGAGHAVIGAYHSHPRSAPEPSPTDVELAFGEFIYIIAGPVSGGRPVEARAYRLEDGVLAPVHLAVED